MASLIQSIMSVFGGADQPSILPTSHADLEGGNGGILASDLLHQQQLHETIDIEEDNKRIVRIAYGTASDRNFRPSGNVYISDFYKGINLRCPISDTASGENIYWRVYEDHPVVEILMKRIFAYPVHRIEDKFGDQLIYTDGDISTGINELVEMCRNDGFQVYDDPLDPEFVDDAPREVDDESAPVVATTTTIINE